MISILLAKLFGLIIERKIIQCIETIIKRIKDIHGSQNQLAIIITFPPFKLLLRMVETKMKICLLFHQLKKKNETMPKAKLRKRLEGSGIPPELHGDVIRFYKNIIAKMKCNNHPSIEINYDIDVK
jgi:hypothetical protein